MSSLFEDLGGEGKLRRIIDRFIDAVYADPMIGFYFARVDRPSLKAREYELAASFLGADIHYAGRPLRQAHQPHRIMGGHFDRRLALLRSALAAEGAPAHVVAAWMTHSETLRPQITGQGEGVCD